MVEVVIMEIKIPLVRPTIDEDDIKSVISAIYEREFSHGKLTHVFENEFANHLGLLGGVATNSGTTALHLALRALNVKEGDEVILPSYTCISLLHSLHYVNAIPIFADINFNVGQMEYNLNAEDVANKITDKTKAIIVPHLFGSPAEIDKINDLGIPVIEDITQSIGSVYKNRPVGSFGIISICSLHESKVLSCGEGGMILTNSKELLDRIKYLADYGYDQPFLRLEKGKSYSYEERYNYKMSGTNAALGTSQLKKIDEFVNQRKTLAKIYSDEFNHIDNIGLPDPSYEPNIFFRYMVNLSEKKPIDILKSLLKQGIEGGRGVYPPLHYFNKQSNINSDQYPTTEYALNHLISIPLYPSLTESEVMYIIGHVKNCLKR